MGKGDKRRPLHISVKEFEANWDNIFPKSNNELTSVAPKVCTTCSCLLNHIEGDEPFTTDHYQCPMCDSTFNTFDKSI